VYTCVHCNNPLKIQTPDSLKCENCAAVFERSRNGYFSMLKERMDISTTSEAYANEQHHCGPAVVEMYLSQFLDKKLNPKILDVGCGVGKSAMALVNAGFDAYGIDLPDLAPFWKAAKNDPDRFVEASATKIPFADNSFDVVYSFGVIEHIGTVNGHCTLASNYQLHRDQYAKEILRITKPGGQILIACPNKSFPIDIQHGPGDAIQQPGRLRAYIFEKTGMNVHKIWGQYHLLSYSEVKNLFVGENGSRHFGALPLRNYFQFGRFKRGFLKPFAPLAELWVNNMPEPVRRTFINPYVMAEIRK
jgi:SAM-dependent methyltransferase